MAAISVRHNFPEIAKQLDRLADDVGNKAIVRALNNTVDQGKVQMAKQISQEFRISSSKVKERLKVSKARSWGRTFNFQAALEATTRSKGRSLNLIAFVTKGRVGKAAAKRLGRSELAGQIQFQIKRGSGKKVIPGAFIANKGRTVFIREGKSRMPIRAVNTIDVPQMFNAKRINSVVRKVMLEKFPPNFQRELRAILRGFAK